MRVPSHVEKVARLVDVRRRLDPLDDFELWFWATLTAGTNMLNASLHRAGLTSDDPVFSTIPGMHWVRQADRSYARELRGPGDISHVGWPPVEGHKPDTSCASSTRWRRSSSTAIPVCGATKR